MTNTTTDAACAGCSPPTAGADNPDMPRGGKRPGAGRKAVRGPMQQVSLYLPAALVAKADALATAKGVGRSEAFVLMLKGRRRTRAG